MSKSFSLSKRRLIAVGVVVLLVVAIAALLLGLRAWEDRTSELPPSPQTQTQTSTLQTQTPTPNDDRAVIYVNGEKYALKENIEAVLFLGIDSYEKAPTDIYLNGQQADLLMLLVLDHNTQSYTALQINRDTMATFQTIGVTGENSGTKTAQIAMSHAYGTGANDSSRNTTKAVSNLLYGVSIPHFVTVRMSAIATLNDAVGGVTLELRDDFTMLDDTFTKGATVTLNGEQATAYVQYRGQLEDSTNISRMERQRQYMLAWLEELRASMETDNLFVSKTALKIADDLISDLTVEQMDKLSDYFSEYTSNGFTQIAGESVMGEEYMEFHVDEAALQAQVLELFYTRVE